MFVSDVHTSLAQLDTVVGDKTYPEITNIGLVNSKQIEVTTHVVLPSAENEISMQTFSESVLPGNSVVAMTTAMLTHTFT